MKGRQTVQAVPLKRTPLNTMNLPSAPSQYNKPLPVRRILEDDIKPPKDEYSQLKELDTRMHVLKFSTDISKTFSGYKQGNIATKPLNRSLYI